MDVYGNTVLTGSAGAASPPSAFTMTAPGTYPAGDGGTSTIGRIDQVRVFNNIFSVQGGADALRAGITGPTGVSNGSIRFDNNRYAGLDGDNLIRFGGSYDGGNSYSGAAATGVGALRSATYQPGSTGCDRPDGGWIQECRGTQGPAGLNRETRTDGGRAPALDGPGFAQLRPWYGLQEASQVKDAGASPASLRVTSAAMGRLADKGKDFFDVPAPAGAWWSVGAADR